MLVAEANIGLPLLLIFYLQTKAGIRGNCCHYENSDIETYIIHYMWIGLFCIITKLLTSHLFHLVVHLLVWLDLPPPGHVPRGIDPVPHLRLGLAVHHLHSLVNNNVVLLKCLFFRSGEMLDQISVVTYIHTQACDLSRF